MDEGKKYYFHDETPLFDSTVIGSKVRKRVLLKMDSFQEGASFKIRGIGYFCAKLVHDKGVNHLVSSSGGNAGYATSFVGKKLGVKVTVFVPITTKPLAIAAMQREGADVIISGSVWDEAHSKALEFATSLDPNDRREYIHPFDHPLIHEGHTTLITEIDKQLTSNNLPMPDCLVVSVGGGGLLCGVVQGMHLPTVRPEWQQVPVIAVETTGAASYNEALKAGKPVTLDKITTIANTLGAKRVCDQSVEWSKNHKIIGAVVTDEQAVNACKSFAADHRSLVEPACAASLAVLYDDMDVIKPYKNVLIIVCGGIAPNIEFKY